MKLRELKHGPIFAWPPMFGGAYRAGDRFPVGEVGVLRAVEKAALHQKLYRLLCSCGVTKTARRGGLADFEEQVLVIAIPATPPEHRADVAVDRFHFAEGNLLVTVVQDPGQMAHQQGAELLEGRQPLPPQ